MLRQAAAAGGTPSLTESCDFTPGHPPFSRQTMSLLYLLMNRLRCQINLVLLHKNCLEVGGRSTVSHGLAGKFVGKKLKTKVEGHQLNCAEHPADALQSGKVML